ncbi:DUF397 domain-containing protein [Streptomyces sp. 7-21]|jgi:hypothetical protein|uniref:DUF397 domain-containing protein n=1 Tax=Streptomyces sp. 7-21 TaxID=2802283 RepID=UPI00191F1208|nr:DUF397 domain-containing protein [Streptomyces sp. 7-21]MBL1067667.1 DUF397 domain-containing protein [Streptomyces sp. 7-21]
MPSKSPAWIRSSYSGNGGADCVEVAAAPPTVRVRDSKNTSGAQLIFGQSAWAAFVISRTKRGR